MDVLEQFNDAVAYIEENMCSEIDTDRISEITFCPYDKFKRFFSYMTNMSVSEYIRKRRLTQAAYELIKRKIKVIDLAVKYGYNSADSFTRAFVKQHGVLPTEVTTNTLLSVYPPVSFYVSVKGASKLDFKIVNTNDIELKGISKQFSGTASERFEQEHIMWSNQHDDVQNKICTTIEGVWYGVWNNGLYSIAKKDNEIDNHRLEKIIIPAGKYAVFSTDIGGFAGDVLPKLREQIFSCWLPDSGYSQVNDFEVEVYYLYPKTQKHKRHYEIWVSIL